MQDVITGLLLTSLHLTFTSVASQPFNLTKALFELLYGLSRMSLPSSFLLAGLLLGLNSVVNSLKYSFLGTINELLHV